MDARGANRTVAEAARAAFFCMAACMTLGAAGGFAGRGAGAAPQPPDSLSLGLSLDAGASQADGFILDLPRDPCLEILSGFEFEGADQSFGFETWLDPASPDWTEETGDLRSIESETELLGLAGFRAQPAPGSAWNPRLSCEARWGANRRSLFSEAEALASSGVLAGLSIRNHLQLDRDEQSSGDAMQRTDAGQELLHLRWKRPAGERRALVLRSALDVSWGEQAGGDSLDALYDYFMDYRKLSAGIGLLLEGLQGGSLYLDFVRKDAGEETHSYDAATLQASYGDFASEGNWSLEAHGERRGYRQGPQDSLAAYSSALASYWETGLRADWRRAARSFELESSLDVTGTLYDDPQAGEAFEGDDLGSLNADRLRIEADILIARDLIGPAPFEFLPARAGTGDIDGRKVTAGATSGRTLENVRLGAGLSSERLWLDAGSGAYASLGGRLEARLEGGVRLGGGWFELAAEAGLRDYRGSDEDLVFDIGGFSFSFAQTDYTYLELSLIGGGRLPWAFEWEIFGFLQQERHTESQDDARLSSLSVALKRRWPVVR